MTCDEYRAKLKLLGLIPVKASYDGATLYQDRERQPHVIPDPEGLNEIERSDFMMKLMIRIGAED